MKRSMITLVRDKYSTSTNTLGADCFTAMTSIPSVRDIQTETVTEDEVVISYLYTGKEKFDRIDEFLSKHGVARKKTG